VVWPSQLLTGSHPEQQSGPVPRCSACLIVGVFRRSAYCIDSALKRLRQGTDAPETRIGSITVSSDMAAPCP